MPDLPERFRSLDRTLAPDLWPEIERRDPRALPEARPRRALVAAVAFAVAAAGVGLAGLTFGGSEPAGVTGTSGSGAVAVTNGSIYFRVGGAGGTRIESIEPDGSGRRVVFDTDPNRIAQVAWSPDGTRIAYQNPIAAERGIYVANADGSDAVRLTDGINDAWPSWSPDGTRILFASSSYDPQIDLCRPSGADFMCPTDIHVMETDGSNVIRLTHDSAPEYQPAWSPNGGRIAFVRVPVTETRNAIVNAPRIFTMDPDGSDVRRVSTGEGGSDFSPTWSADGSQLAFAAIRNEDWGIWVVDSDGSDAHLVLGSAMAGHVEDPEWSPDGRLIAFVGNLTVDDYSPDDALYVMSPDGTGITPLADAPGVGVAGDIAWQPMPATAVKPVPSPTTTSLTAELVETFEVALDVRSVAFGEGSVWVAASNDDGAFGGRIIRIDPVTHEVQAEIAVRAIPTWEVGGGAMTFADGDLWVAGDVEKPGDFDDPGGGADAAVVRIDASTSEVVRVFEMGGTGAADLAFLNGDLWVLVFGDETVDHKMEVARVDPMTGDVVARVPLSSGWAHSIVAAGERLVVLEGGDDAVNVDGRVAVIDPVTNTVTRTELPRRFFTPIPALSRGQVWISLDPGFVRFDPATARFPDPVISLPARFSDCCGVLEADDRGIWFLGLAQTGTGSELNLFDPATGEVTRLLELTDGNHVAMAIAPDAVWILNYNGTVTHVALG